MNNIFQVNGLNMVDEPMEEGEADSCQVSTHVNLLSKIFRIQGKNIGKRENLLSVKAIYSHKLIIRKSNC